MIRTLPLLLVLLLASCGGKKEQAPASTVPSLKVAILKPEDRTIYQSFSAVLEGRQNVEIRPKVTGFIEKIYVDEGQRVLKGQPLFKLETQSLSQDARAAEAAVNVARVEVDKLVPLVEKGIISEVQLETARARMRQAESNYASIRASIGYSSISSPANGHVGAIPYKEGALVSNTMAQPLTVVSDISQVRAYFAINEKQLLRMKDRDFDPGRDSVEFEMVNGRMYPSKGYIAMVNNIIDNATGNVTLRADFLNPDRLLSSGSTGKVRIPTKYSGIFIIPMTATVDLQGNKLVYVVNQDGTVTSKPLDITAQTATEYLVMPNGLETGTTIVIEGVSRLQDGQQIRPLNE